MKGLLNKISKGFLVFLAFLMAIFAPASGLNISSFNVKAASDATTHLIIHYHRFDGNYDKWNLWLWNGEANGADFKPSAPYQFTGSDSFGKVADLTFNVKTSKVGIIVRKGEWEEKDITDDRAITGINGTKEIWLVQGIKDIYDKKPEIAPKMTAFLDGKRTIKVKLQDTIKLTGKNNEGFKVLENGFEETPVNIVSVKNAMPLPSKKQLSQKPEDRGYDIINGGKQIKFILKPGCFGFKDTTGNQDIYLSGTMNDWGGTSGPKSVYAPLSDWKLSYNKEKGEYELIKNLGTDGDSVSVGSKFKFTSYDGKDATWYPGGSGNDNVINQLASNDSDRNTTDLVSVTVDKDLDLRTFYELDRKGFKSASVKAGKVLDSKDYYYGGNDLGVTYGETQSTFKLWAPTALKVSLLLFNDPKTESSKTIDMTRQDNGVWSLTVKGNLDGKYYLFDIFHQMDGALKEYKVNDPYAFGSSANSGRSLIYDHNKVNNEVVGWDKDKYVSLKNYVDAVIYEAHVRDFTISKTSGVKEEYAGKYLGFVQEGTKTDKGTDTGIDHLKDLGITHVHLLPTYDYGTGNENSIKDTYNWGYDPVLYNNVEGMYATNPDGTARQKEYKEMVLGLHKAGMGVITDMVFNHTLAVGDADMSIFDKIVPGYFYRTDDDGNYSNGSGCGNEIASERPMVRKFIIDSVKYWIKEYHVDGLRFDLMAVLDKDTMAQVYKEAKKINPNVIIYGEGWDAGASTLDPGKKMNKTNLKGSNLHIAMFNDEIREDVKGNNDGDVKGFAQGGGFRNGADRLEKEIMGLSDYVSSPEQSINYVTCHDNLCLWDKIVKSNPDATLSEKVSMNNLANGIILTSQGVPFIQGGSEFGRSKSLAATPNNTYNDVKGNDFDWTLLDTNKSMNDYYAGLIALRKAHPAFRMVNSQMIKSHISFIKADDNIIQYTISGNANGDAWKNIMVIYNGSGSSSTLKASGQWNITVNGEKAGVTDLSTANDSITVPAYSMVVAYQK